jgi:hypothetical protein
MSLRGRVRAAGTIAAAFFVVQVCVRRQWRVGAHLTGLKTKDAEGSLGAGFAEDSSHRSSPCVRLGVMARR